MRKQGQQWAATGAAQPGKKHRMYQLCGKSVCSRGVTHITGMSGTTWTKRTRAAAEELYTEKPHGNKVRRKLCFDIYNVNVCNVNIQYAFKPDGVSRS